LVIAIHQPFQVAAETFQPLHQADERRSYRRRFVLTVSTPLFLVEHITDVV